MKRSRQQVRGSQFFSKWIQSNCGKSRKSRKRQNQYFRLDNRFLFLIVDHLNPFTDCVDPDHQTEMNLKHERFGLKKLHPAPFVQLGFQLKKVMINTLIRTPNLGVLIGGLIGADDTFNQRSKIKFHLNKLHEFRLS